MIFLMMLLAFGQPAQEIRIELEIPKLDASPYHKPYVAVWLETTERKGMQTLAVWHEKEDWLKDMRQWWRKLGRGNTAYDSVSGATRKPGKHTITWKAVDGDGKPLPAGTYYLNVEAAREQGGRDFLRQKIEIDNTGHQYTLEGDLELGTIIISINGASS